MSNTPIDFTKEQWEFLSVFDALGAPVSLDIVGALAPLLPTASKFRGRYLHLITTPVRGG